MIRWTASTLPLMLLWAVTACAQADFGIGLDAGNVKGAPFSADTVIESSRVLGDGNHIHNLVRGKLFRDSQGRTRSESSVAVAGLAQTQHVTISDPVRHVMISFEKDGDKKAVVFHTSSTEQQTAVSSDTPTTDKKEESPKASTEKVSDDDEPCAAEPGYETLPSKTIEGLLVGGTRHTSTIEAGQIGNEKPIISVTETWYSDELQVTVLTDMDDPQEGHTTTKLVNIQKGEPDAALFQVPEGYTVRDFDPAKLKNELRTLAPNDPYPAPAVVE